MWTFPHNERVYRVSCLDSSSETWAEEERKAIFLNRVKFPYKYEGALLEHAILMACKAFHL